MLKLGIPNWAVQSFYGNLGVKQKFGGRALISVPNDQFVYNIQFMHDMACVLVCNHGTYKWWRL